MGFWQASTLFWRFVWNLVSDWEGRCYRPTGFSGSGEATGLTARKNSYRRARRELGDLEVAHPGVLCGLGGEGLARTRPGYDGQAARTCSGAGPRLTRITFMSSSLSAGFWKNAAAPDFRARSSLVWGSRALSTITGMPARLSLLRSRSRTTKPSP